MRIHGVCVEIENQPPLCVIPPLILWTYFLGLGFIAKGRWLVSSSSGADPWSLHGNTKSSTIVCNSSTHLVDVLLGIGRCRLWPRGLRLLAAGLRRCAWTPASLADLFHGVSHHLDDFFPDFGLAFDRLIDVGHLLLQGRVDVGACEVGEAGGQAANVPEAVKRSIDSLDELGEDLVLEDRVGGVVHFLQSKGEASRSTLANGIIWIAWAPGPLGTATWLGAAATGGCELSPEAGRLVPGNSAGVGGAGRSSLPVSAGKSWFSPPPACGICSLSRSGRAAISKENIACCIDLQVEQDAVVNAEPLRSEKMTTLSDSAPSQKTATSADTAGEHMETDISSPNASVQIVDLDEEDRRTEVENDAPSKALSAVNPEPVRADQPDLGGSAADAAEKTAKKKKRKRDGATVAERVEKKLRAMKEKNVSKRTGAADLQHRPREKEVPDGDLVTPEAQIQGENSLSTVSLSTDEIFDSIDVDQLDLIQDSLLVVLQQNEAKTAGDKGSGSSGSSSGGYSPDVDIIGDSPAPPEKRQRTD
ncbi:hypothetical protein KSP40_PGU001259 [Platanthera guangdongensis]|uniref:Uncharacterized protein n=1 Tax=Platanthera guangdongensis TaxID=2320717 RepID=A0ABR2M922_9ASPA